MYSSTSIGKVPILIERLKSNSTLGTLSYAPYHPTRQDDSLVDSNDVDAAAELFAKLEADRVRIAANTPLPYIEALEHCREWILEKGATTRSAEVLEALLLSLADEGQVNLSDVRVLDTERRLWLISVLLHLEKINDSELRYAAGMEYGEDAQDSDRGA